MWTFALIHRECEFSNSLTYDVEEQVGDGGGRAVEVDPAPVPARICRPYVVQDEARWILRVIRLYSARSLTPML